MPDAPIPPPSEARKGMFLSRLDCTNFRSCHTTSVHFQADLTVLVGENNSGKSNIIDALRLATAPATGRRSRYFEEGDLTRGGPTSTIKLQTIFENLSDIQKGLYFTAMNVETEQCLYATEFSTDKLASGKLARPTLLAGPANGFDVELDARERIRHVYLAPLRDAQRELDSPEAGRLLSVIELLTTKDQRDDLLDKANTNLKELQEHEAVTGPTQKIKGHISGLTSPVREQQVDAQFTGFRLRQLVRSLRIKMSEAGFDLADLSESGLGYANLLFVATVLLELQNAKDAELTLFLVEEPEAHLHPQLQAVLLDYLMDQAKKSTKDDAESPAGRIQVICTSHSPNLASSVPVENVVVVRSSIVAGAPCSGTRTVPLANLAISKAHLAKVSRFLDATKASLLFARKLMLVEGLAEAILVPSVAKRVLGEEFAKFSGVTVIAVGGVDFEPYLRLLMTRFDGVSILDKLTIVTDRDPNPVDWTVPVDRKANLDAVAAEIGSADRVTVFTSTYTLEADLMAHPLNRPLLKLIYLEQHPQSVAKWELIEAAVEPEKELHTKLSLDKKLLSKGEFAQSLAGHLQTVEEFHCPQYLHDSVMNTIEPVLAVQEVVSNA